MGDDALFRRPGPVLVTQRLKDDLAAAAGDERLGEVRGARRGGAIGGAGPGPTSPLSSQPARALAASLLAERTPPLDAVRAVYRALGRAGPGAPSLAAALDGDAPRRRAAARPPLDPSSRARLQALRDAADQAAYDAMVADVTGGGARGGGAVRPRPRPCETFGARWPSPPTSPSRSAPGMRRGRPPRRACSRTRPRWERGEGGGEGG